MDVPPPSNVSKVNTKIKLKRDIFEMYLKLALSDFTKDYLIKKKIIPDSIQSMATGGGAIANALAFGGSNFCSVLCIKNQSKKN